MRRFALLLSSVVWGAGLWACVPLSPPEPIVPQYDPLRGAAADGYSRVVLDVKGRRCRVRLANQHQVRQVLVQQRSYRHGYVLCVTPCQLELKQGPVRLRFCDEADATVHVRRHPTVFRIAVDGRRRPAAVQWAPE